MRFSVTFIRVIGVIRGPVLACAPSKLSIWARIEVTDGTQPGLRPEPINSISCVSCISWLSSIERFGRGDHETHEIHETFQTKVIHRFRGFSQMTTLENRIGVIRGFLCLGWGRRPRWPTGSLLLLPQGNARVNRRFLAAAPRTSLPGTPSERHAHEAAPRVLD